MTDKVSTYVQFAQKFSKQIISSHANWTSYLNTAARMYKYQYQDQLLIYAQRPDATACAEYDLWNDVMHRYVRRGSKGIALLQTQGDQTRLRYVFDVSDTGTRRTSLDPYLWEITPHNELAIAAMLDQTYGVDSNMGLSYQLTHIAQQQATVYWQDHRQEILRIVDGSFLEEYDEINVGMSFRRAASASIGYTLHVRCGLDAHSVFIPEDFTNVFDWNTPDAVGTLGAAVSEISGTVLRQIELTAKSVERSLENERTDLHQSGRLPVPEYQPAAAEHEAPEQVRTDAEEVSDGASAADLPDHAAERDTGHAPAGDQRDGGEASGADDAGADEDGERDGGDESQRPDALDRPDEQPESAGRGNPAGGAGQQLTLWDAAYAIPDEAEQINNLMEAERAIFAPFAFSLPQEDIDHILRTGSNTSNHRMILVAEFSKQKPLEEMTAMLRRVYHGGNGIATEHGRVTAWYAEDGIHLATGGTARYTRTAQVLSWTDAAKRIGELLDAGHFATNIEVAAAAGHERHRMAEAMVNLYWDTSAEAREQGYMATLGGMCSGSHPASVEAATNALADPALMPAMLAEYKDFRAACKETPGLMRFRYHFIDELDVLVNEYTMPRREFSSTMPEIPNVLPFITDDELAEAISHGSSFTSGKARIYEFFIQPHTPKEYADFLKKEYGIGGHSHAISGATYSDESYDGKGLHYKKRDCPDINLSWPQAVKRIQDLIRLDRYLTPQQKAELDAIREMHDVPTEIPDERILEVRDPDEINVEYVRARLEEAGIVNGEVVDPEKLANAPIVRAVEAIAAEMEQEADKPAALTDAEYAQQFLTPDETVFEIDGRTYMVDRVNLEAGTVNIQDITFSNAPASPIFRVEPISFVRKAIEEADAANPLLDPTRYQLMEIAGQEAIFSNGRFDRDKLPDFLHCYDIRDDSYGNPARLEPSVVVNHFGSILTKRPIEFPPEGYIDLIADNDWTFGEEQLTVADFIRRPEPREYTAEVEAVYPAEQNGTAFDVVVEKLRFDPPAQEKPVPGEEESQPIITETPYRAGDILYLDNQPFIVESIGIFDVHMRDPNAAYPIMRAESKERLERLLALDQRNAAYLPRDNAVLEPAPVQQITPENYRITDDRLGEGGPKEKFKRNVEAIRVLKALEADNRPASPAEQAILAQYVGWGGLADAFDEHKAAWASEYAQLRNLLTQDEYNAAMGSVLNAHYTSPTIIRAIYDAVERMGFTSGNVLEPAMGVGNFFGMMPESMSDSRLYGVELDSISGRIAKQLYPKADITVAGFETTDRRDFFDLAVGNVPFGNYKVDDKAYNRLGFSIHNYFIAKMIDQVRPGGMVAVITSRYTMDQQSPEVRKYLAERAELLGAIRLPNDAFRANAGTDVVADILFFQKRERAMTIEPDWVHLGENADGFAINQYFIDHPEMVLGEQTSESTQYGQPGYTVSPTAGTTLADELRDAVQRIHGTYVAAALPELAEGEEIRESIPADPNVKNYSYTIVDGQVYYRENSIMVRPDLNQTAQERVKGLVGLRDCVHALIDAQMDEAGDSAIQGLQAELNQRYDAFTAKYGLINARGNALAFSDDSSYYLLCSLEVLDDQQQLKRKADMFTKRTIKQQKVIEHVDTAVEALTVSIAERVGVDLPFMAQLTGKPEDELADELTGVIFPLPESVGAGQPLQYVTANEYLSGNVRQKFRDARLMAEHDARFIPNVEALAAAQPKDLDASEIDIRLGATWVHKDYIQQFMLETFNTPFHLKRQIQVHFSPYTAEWNITGKTAISSTNVAAYTTFGTDRANAYRILEDTLNLRDTRIYDIVLDEEGKEKRVLNQQQTTLAQQKQQAIKDAFRDWVWRDPDRRHALVQEYNERFNSTRPREFDGSHISFVGINPEITLREHQRNAVAHVLYGGNTLLAHEVGAGKTFEMIAACMESKRLGLCQKAMFVVPNHLTEQWASEFLRLYPSARILVTTKKDFERHNRQKFCSRIATGDYDAVIIGHSQFERIPVSQARQERFIQEQIDEVVAGINELKRSHGEQFTIKQLVRTQKQLELRLKKLQAEGKKDDVVTFEQLGVDRLYVDEAHGFKNLFLYTKMRNVAGLSTSEAQKSSDMFMKCRYMDELTGGRGIVFATGTPVSNSMTELYTMQRYLQYSTLKRSNMTHFDAWASTFGETTTAIELAPEGTGYRARTRFARFFNLPELMTIFKEVADIKTADQLHLPTPKANFETVVVQPTEQQAELVQALSERAAEVHSGNVDPSIDNMLKITSDGRKLGLDQRLINPMLPDDPGSKVNACVRNIHRIWQEGMDQRLTQLVFCDISTPKATAGAENQEFSVYDDIRAKLISMGVPAEEIAFIHDANTEARKKELFGKVRSGQVRVLMGSTAKMGAGTNVQDRLVALHDLDCPWRPGDLEQRAGRIVRQGNQNEEVFIYRYVTEKTFDAYLWQTVENKQKFISQIMTSKSPVRSCEDVDETALSYAEIKALCAGDPTIKEKMDLDIDVARLRLMKADHQSKQYRLEDQLLRYFPQVMEQQRGFITGFQADLETLAAHPLPEKDFIGMEVMGKRIMDKEKAGEALLDACKGAAKSNQDVAVGHYRGLDMSIAFEPFSQLFYLTLRGQMSHKVELGSDARGNLVRIENALANIPNRLAAAQAELENQRQQMEAAKAEVGKPFPQEAELQTKSARLAELDAKLNMDRKPSKAVDLDEKQSIQDALRQPGRPGNPTRPNHREEAR